MRLYLIRHADAGDPERFEGPDEERPLSDVGFAQAQALAAALREHGIVFDAVVTSPLLRARQTAQELMPPSGPDAPSAGPAECEFLAPGGRRRKLARYLEELDKESVALVGHRPDIDELAGWLIGYRKAGIGLAKGAAALIDCDGAPGKGSGTLRWLLTPEWVGAAEHPAEEGEMNGGTRKRRPAAGKRR